MQKDSLLSLFSATGGPYWINKDNWNVTTDPCTWHGVACNASTGDVTQIFLNSNNLTGSLPDLQLPALFLM